jgi:hypothetical protein
MISYLIVVEGYGRLTNSLELTVNAEFERESTGKRTVTPVPWPANHRAAQVTAWLERARGMSGADLAERLGISERHGRRIKAGKVTVELLNRLMRGNDNLR